MSQVQIEILMEIRDLLVGIAKKISVEDKYLPIDCIEDSEEEDGKS